MFKSFFIRFYCCLRQNSSFMKHSWAHRLPVLIKIIQENLAVGSKEAFQKCSHE